MLSELHLVDTGPGPKLDLELGPRLNVLTGDNGLGKSFVLDVIWWVLTGAWGGYPAGPFRPPGRKFSVKDSRPSIAWTEDSGQSYLVNYQHAFQRWEERSRPAPGGPVLYARADGSIQVCDLREVPGGPSERNFTVWTFNEEALWEGYSINGERICRGLLEDWVTWRLMHAAGQDSPYEVLEAVLVALSPQEGEELRLGEPIRVYLDKKQDIPVLQFKHATVPVIHASVGMKRILALAYMLVWTWTEHLRAVQLAGLVPNPDLVLMIDEVEAHLHPQWQRRIVPALMRAVHGFWTEELRVQVIITTHSPLVLASLEPSFDPERDSLFRFEVQGEQAMIERQYWAKQGDAVNWLVSPQGGTA